MGLWVCGGSGRRRFRSVGLWAAKPGHVEHAAGSNRSPSLQAGNPAPQPSTLPPPQDGATRAPHFAVPPTPDSPTTALCAGARDDFTCVPVERSRADVALGWLSPAGCAGMCLCRGRGCGAVAGWGHQGHGEGWDGTREGWGHSAAETPRRVGTYEVLELLHGSYWGARGEGGGTCGACTGTLVCTLVCSVHTLIQTPGSLHSPGCRACIR